MKTILDWDTPPRIDSCELIDDETQPYQDFRASMKDVQQANRYLGGTSVVSGQARVWLRSVKRGRDSLGDRPVTFLDVATGSGDLPYEILKVAKRENVPVRIIGLDYSEPILKFAREEIGERAIRLTRGSAYQLPFADASIDYVLCSLAFHHFGFIGCRLALAEMERVSRLGWLVNDLRRAWSAWYLFRAVSTLCKMNRMTRHDGPASVLRAYSLPEYGAMPEQLGIQMGKDFVLRRSLFYRVALVREKPGRSRQAERPDDAAYFVGDDRKVAG